MTSRYSIALAALSLASGVQSAAVVQADETSLLQIPNIQADPSHFIDPDFPGLAFEQASFVNYAVNDDGTPNAFSQNLVDAIYTRTGGKPLIRLGGTSGDYAKYVADQTEPALPRAEVDNFQDVGNTTIGPAYWDIASKAFPKAQYVVQVPLADPDKDESVRWATAAAARIGLARIHSFEPGNEPDLYPAKGLGPPEWRGPMDNGSYVVNFLNYADAISSAVGLPRGTRMFQALDTASHTADPEQDVFSIALRNVMQQGLDNHHEVKTIARHYYQTDGGHAADLATGLMNHGAIKSRLDLYRDDIEFLASRNPKIPFVLSEVGNSLNPKHDYNYQATLGSALWQVDFQLYGLSIGISRFNFQQIMHSGFDLWLPEASAGMQPQVFANYYAQPFVADFVGTSGVTQVTNIPLEPNVSAYVAYEDGTAKRAAIVNLKYWSKCRSKGESRIAQQVRVQVPFGVDKVKIVHLTSPGGASAKAKTVTYAGSQWTYESEGKEVTGVRNDGDVQQVVGGSVTVPIKASEAVIVHFL